MLHALISFLHGTAHQNLDVQLSQLQTVFVAVVITITPIIAAVLLWKDVTTIGSILLVCSMTGSLIFGVYNHFVAISPDHVAHLANTTDKNWIWIFRSTAVLNAVIEAFGIWIGVKLLSTNAPLTSDRD